MFYDFRDIRFACFAIFVFKVVTYMAYELMLRAPPEKDEEI